MISQKLSGPGDTTEGEFGILSEVCKGLKIHFSEFNVFHFVLKALYLKFLLYHGTLYYS